MAPLALLLLTGFGPADDFGPANWDKENRPPMADGDPEGTVYLSKDQFIVHTKDSVDYVYEVGENGMSAGDAIRIEDPIFHGMRWSKWGNLITVSAACTELSTGQAHSDGLVTASTSGAANISLDRNTLEVDNHEYAYTEVVLLSGSLDPGDRIFVKVGDERQGENCGHQFPDRAFKQVSWYSYEKLGTASDWTLLEAPTFQVSANPTPTSLAVTAPSYVVAGEPFALKVAVLDSLGNPVPTWGKAIQVEADYGAEEHVFTNDEGGWHDFSLTLDEVGVHRIEVSGGPVKGTSNPIKVVEEAPERNLYWGDIHVHHGYHYTDSDGVIQDENHIYARDVLGLDVVSESQKWEPIELNGSELWEYLKEDCAASTTEDYLVLSGSEWMGPDAIPQGQGHHNVYYNTCDAPYGTHAINGLDEEGGLYEVLEDLETELGIETVVIPHAMPFTGHNWTARNDELRSVAEIYSEWGNSIEPTTKPGTIGDGINSGNRMGFIAASDNHDGWMGNPYSYKSAFAGLAAFWSPSLDRQEVFDALKGKQTYGTTGPRIIVELEVDDGATVWPGTEYIAEAPTFNFTVHGSGVIDEIMLVAMPIEEDAGSEELYSDEPLSMDVEGSFTWDYDGGDYAVWLTVGQDDGDRAWSTPIWFTTECGRVNTEDPAERCEPVDTSPVETADPDDTAGDGGDGGKDGGRCDGCASAVHPGAGLGILGLLLLRRRRRG